jgi:mono/diheme cytochrome c family protein
MAFGKSPFWLSGSAFLALAAVAAAAPDASSAQQKSQAGQKGTKPAAPSAKNVASPGEKIFKEQCAPCHGAKGEGTGAYSRALTGDLSAGQLAKYLAKSMPPGPKKIKPADAEKVADYIYGAFYSPLAQERNRPARVALSRLTVRQLRNSVTDLIGTFGGNFTPNVAEHGLKAEYFKAKRFQQDDRVMERTDAQVNFDFGTGGPSGGEFNPHQFSIRWNGSVVAADTGVYEFVVRSDHAIRLYVNDNRKALIDAWVKSGKDTEFRGSLYLVGGRTYPIRLEFSKSTQGVDDTKAKEGKPAPPASVTLAWKRPKQVEEPIPSLCLLPAPSPESFVVTAPFPPDDRSMGYERGDSVSRAWDDATTSAALETADYVATRLKALAGSDSDVAQLKAFCKRFVERALRRPLDAETEGRYITKQFDSSTDVKVAVKRVVLLTLKSPRFLYREVGASDTDPYAIASRLSFTLWDSMPDEALLKVAASGGMATREQVMGQAERMAADPRAWYKQREFFLQWLKVDQYPDLAKDAKRFPDFTPAVATDLRTSFDLTLENVVRSERSDFRELLLSDKVYLNGRLAKLYGVPNVAPDAPFQPISLDPNARSGILTHPYLLSSFAYVATSSPIHRGVLIARNIMGRTLQPPPEAFVPLDANLHPKLTTRQRVSLQTKPAACSTSCHNLINPLGFTMERFDAIGRLRTAENGQPIDSSGAYEQRDGKLVKFTGARDLARFAAESDETHAAFVEKIFQFFVKQPIRAYGPNTAPNLQRTFKENGYNIRRLTAQIAVESALPKPRNDGKIARTD